AQRRPGRTPLICSRNDAHCRRQKGTCLHAAVMDAYVSWRARFVGSKLASGTADKVRSRCFRRAWPPFSTVVGVAQPAGQGAPVELIGACPATCPFGSVCPGTAAGLRASDQRGPLVLGRCARVAGGAGCGRRLSHGRRRPPPPAAARTGGRQG